MSKEINAPRPPKKVLKEEKQRLLEEEIAKSLEALKAVADETERSDYDKDDEYLKKKKTRKELKAEKKAERAERRKQPLSPMAKIFLGLLALAASCFVIYLIYYFVHYVGYKGYRQFLDTYDYEEGRAFVKLEGTNVPGFDKVAESAFLELYTDTETANIAVYDKRNGETVYANPLNADEDTVANPANINLLKSQFVLYYYNDDVVSGMWNSYTDSVAKHKYSYEGIENGIRYIYTIGDGITDFVVPLEYRLYDDYFEVNIPADHIEELGAGYVYRIQLLRYLGATGYDDEGYFVVPNGSGSIINFNNGKTTAAMYSQYIYDIDPLAATYTTVEPLEVARLPLYGVCSDKSDILVTIEDSASNCVINAQVSGVFNDYNFAFPIFVTRTVDDLKNFGDSTAPVQVMEKEMYKAPMRVRYTLLPGEYKGYSGIANFYRERLISEGVLEENESDRDIPFYYDVIGAVKETGHIMGVQYLHSFPMTTFDQASQMSDILTEKGVTNQVMNFQGWFNGGYHHNATNRFRIAGNLGGKSDLEALNDHIVSNGGSFYADVAFTQVTFADTHFPYSQVAARYYGSGYAARFGLVNPTTYRNTSGLGYSGNMYNAISPKFLPRYVKSFINKSKRVDLHGISLRDLGSYLISDKKRTEVIEREQALDIVTGQFELLEATGRKLMTSQANAYAFPYSTDIINVPLQDTEFAIVDAQIPLYEMIIHGYINYSSGLLNYENDDDMAKTELLLIESGASPHFVFTWEESSRMKMTALNRYYNTTFANQADEAVEIYTYVNNALKSVQNEDIVSHEILSENVRKITYSNGTVIYINYGKAPEDIDGITVDGMSYLVR